MSDREPEVQPNNIYATNPERLKFTLAEATGGGAADGMELCVMIVEPWTHADGTEYPEYRVVFSRLSSDLVIKALVSYLTRDEEDREADRRRNEPPEIDE